MYLDPYLDLLYYCVVVVFNWSWTNYISILSTEASVKIPEIERAVGVCKKIVSAFSYTHKRRKALAKAQAELHLPHHRLITETPTRWGSRQQMIARVLEQEKAIAQVLKEDKKTRHLLPTWQDLDGLESVNKALSPLVEFTDALSGEDYVSVSYLKPVLHVLNTTVLAAAEDDTKVTKRIKGGILQYLNDKYDDPATDDLLDMASLVDPRFKMAYIADHRKDYIKTKAMAEMQALLEKQTQAQTSSTQASSTQASSSTHSPTHSSTGPAAAEVVEAKRMKRSLGSFFKKESIPGPAALPDREAIDIELQSYLQALEVDGEANPLDWWRLHEANFPRVASLARRYLCIPATSAPSERAFSTGGNIVTCHRAVLKPENVDRLVFLAKNLP